MLIIFVPTDRGAHILFAYTMLLAMHTLSISRQKLRSKCHRCRDEMPGFLDYCLQLKLQEHILNIQHSIHELLNVFMTLSDHTYHYLVN